MRFVPGGYFQKVRVGVCGTTLTLFQTKICDFLFPISDLIKNLIPYFRPLNQYLISGTRDKLLRHVHGWRHPRRPRGSQSGREKRWDESFQVRAKEPREPTLTELFPKIQADAGS